MVLKLCMQSRCCFVGGAGAVYAGGAGAVYAVAEGALYSDVACVVHVFRMLLMLLCNVHG